MTNEKEIKLVEQIEELQKKVNEARELFFEREYLINQDIKIRDVQYYGHKTTDKMVLENSFIVYPDGSFDVSISSFSARGVLSDEEANRVEKEVNEQIKLYSTLISFLNFRNTLKKEASRIIDKYAKEIYPLEKELYGLGAELRQLRIDIKNEKLKKNIELYKNELLNAGNIYVIQSMQFNNREYYSEFSFTTDKKGNLIVNAVRDFIEKKIKIKDEDIRKIHNQIFREVGKLRFNIDEKYYKRWNIISKEEYKAIRTKGYDDLEWKECTYEEYRKLI
jgi:hypothetical protein